jgi:hypothetical protein
LDITKCRSCGQVHARSEDCEVTERTLRVLNDTELDALPPAEWDIGDVSQTGTLEVVYGPSGAGKSTLCAERACCMATGREWFGKRVRQKAPVVVLVLEGLGAFVKKIRDWKRRHGYTDRDCIGVYVIPEHVNLLDFVDVTHLIQHTERVGAGELMIDTLAQSIVAEEDNEAFQRAVANAAAIRRQTGARVTLLHHSGKDRKRGARGGSSLVAAADTVIAIDQTKRGPHIVRCEKQRDGRPFNPFFLKLVPTEDSATAYFQPTEGPKACLVPDADDMLQAEILKFLRAHPGTKGAMVAEGIHKQKSLVLKALLDLKEAGQADYQLNGRAQLWRVNGSDPEGGP